MNQLTKPMKCLTAFLGILATIILPACVSSKTLIGTKSIEAVPSEWTGKWLSNEGSIAYCEVADAKNGVLELANVTKTKGKWSVETYTGKLRRTGELTFLNIYPAASPDGPYNVFVINSGRSEKWVWHFDQQKIANLVQAGTLKGTVNKGGPK